MLINRYRITFRQKYTSPERVEVIEAEGTTGQRAKKAALAKHGGRLGLVYVKRGRGYWATDGWTIRIELIKEPCI